MDTLLEMQPRISGAGGGSNISDTVFLMAGEYLRKLPKDIDPTTPEEMLSLDIFKYQEIERFNALLKVMRSSLIEL